MAFVVEDGTGLASANSYVSVANFKTYCDNKGSSYVGKTDAQIEQALVRATAFIDGNYRSAFGGLRVAGRQQALEFPRAGMVDEEGYAVSSIAVPDEVAAATSEAAIRELASAGSLNPDVKPGGGVIRRVKAGSTEVEFQPNAATQTTFTRIDQALAPLIGGQSSYSGAASRA